MFRWNINVQNLGVSTTLISSSEFWNLISRKLYDAICSIVLSKTSSATMSKASQFPLYDEGGGEQARDRLYRPKHYVLHCYALIHHDSWGDMGRAGGALMPEEQLWQGLSQSMTSCLHEAWYQNTLLSHWNTSAPFAFLQFKPVLTHKMIYPLS